MDIVRVRKARSDGVIPQRASAFAVGYDVYASRILDKETKDVLADLPGTIQPGESLLIGIGVSFAVPWPWEAQLRPRSGLANKYDIELSNSPGTIDPDFRGEAGALLRNRGKNPFVVEKGMRVAQLIFAVVQTPVFLETDQLPPTIRGDGGFGSTGLFEISEGTAEYWKKVREEDTAYMRVVQALANFPSEGTGSCIIVKNGSIISTSHSLFRTGEAPVEGMAFCNLLRVGSGVSTKGARVYLNTEPTESFSFFIVASGIKEVILPAGDYQKDIIEFLEEAGLFVRYVNL